MTNIYFTKKVMLDQLHIVSFFHIESDFTLSKQNNNSIIYQWCFTVVNMLCFCILFMLGLANFGVCFWVHEMMTFVRII